MATVLLQGEAPSGESACRALVVVGVSEASCTTVERPLAGFVAQLIANERRLPAYRTARLAEPGEATGRYAGITRMPVGLLDRVV